MAHVLAPDIWMGSERGLWQHLEGYQNRKTPLSDHLAEVFGVWAKSFAGLTEDFETLFDRYEIIASLFFFSQHELSELQKAKQEHPREQFAPALQGRFGWRRGSDALSRTLNSEAIKPKLLDAGFARGSDNVFQLFLENLTYVVSRMRW